MSSKKGPRILILDLETAPILAEVWAIWDQNIGLNQIVKDWSILAWTAKWRGEKKIHYRDTGNQKDVRDDSKILKPLFKLMQSADIIVGQNSKRFDVPKLNARFIINKTFGYSVPQGYRQHDTMRMAKSKYGFTSFRLEYMANALGLKNKKMVQRKFAGHELWKECLKGNKDAWKEMRKYNPQDVITTEELYEILLTNDNTINFNVYDDNNENKCSCGSFVVRKNGHRFSNAGKYQSFSCGGCGKRWQGKTNLLTKIKRRDMLK
jgi:hypothetical protein